MRTPPHNRQAELTIIGALLDPTWTGPLPDIPPDDFYDPILRRWWTHKNTQTPHQDHPRLAAKAIREWVPPLDKAAQQIRQTAAHRRLIKTITEAAELSWHNPQAAVQRLHQP
jgi:replicative DNA helicase